MLCKHDGVSSKPFIYMEDSCISYNLILFIIFYLAWFHVILLLIYSPTFKGKHSLRYALCILIEFIALVWHYFPQKSESHVHKPCRLFVT